MLFIYIFSIIQYHFFISRADLSLFKKRFVISGSMFKALKELQNIKYAKATQFDEEENLSSFQIKIKNLLQEWKPISIIFDKLCLKTGHIVLRDPTRISYIRSNIFVLDGKKIISAIENLLITLGEKKVCEQEEKEFISHVKKIITKTISFNQLCTRPLRPFIMSCYLKKFRWDISKIFNSLFSLIITNSQNKMNKKPVLQECPICTKRKIL